MKEYDYEWEEVTRTKEVLAFGKKLIVPTWVKYVSVDNDGDVMGSEGYPVAYTRHWQPFEYSMALGKIKMKPEYNWTTMIIEV